MLSGPRCFSSSVRDLLRRSLIPVLVALQSFPSANAPIVPLLFGTWDCVGECLSVAMGMSFTLRGVGFLSFARTLVCNAAFRGSHINGSVVRVISSEESDLVPCL